MVCYAIIILAGILAVQPNLLAALTGIIRPQMKRHKEPTAKIRGVKRNDRLVTFSGIGKLTKGIVPKGGAPVANN